MFRRLQSRRRKPPSNKPRRRRLVVERLETRDCPAAPFLNSFSAAILGGNLVHLSGSVTADEPTACAVRFSGVINDIAVPVASGAFDTAVEATALGTITAVAENAQLQQSNQLQATTTSNVPQLTLTRTYGAGGTVTLAGHVTDESPTWCPVTLSGAVSAVVIPNAGGDFSYTTQNWQLDEVTALTVDPWSQGSNQPAVTLANTAPVIAEFHALEGSGGVWTFQGRVTDEFAPGLQVRLWGIPTLGGTTGYTEVTVGNDGWFSYSVTLGPLEQGTVSAQVADWWNVPSPVVTDIVQPTLQGGWGQDG